MSERGSHASVGAEGQASCLAFVVVFFDRCQIIATLRGLPLRAAGKSRQEAGVELEDEGGIQCVEHVVTVYLCA